MDVASSEFYDAKTGKYTLEKSGEGSYDSKGFIEYLKKLVKDHPAIITIEDGLAESDWEGWALLTKELGGKIQLVGDDLFVTNPAFLRKGIDNNVATKSVH